MVQMKANARQVLESDIFYGIGLGKTRTVGRLTSLSKIVGNTSRIPQQETVEALKLLAQAWDTVDYCHKQAAMYKFGAKVAYVVQLMLGIAAVILSLAHERETPQGGTSYYQDAVLAVAVAATFVAGITAFYNPQSRWKELRCVAASLQSTIFLFRTRTGDFAGWNPSNSSNSVSRLCDAVRLSHDALYDKGDLAQDTIAAKLMSSRKKEPHCKSVWAFYSATIGRLCRWIAWCWWNLASPFRLGSWRDMHVPPGHRKVVNGWPHLEEAEIKRRNDTIKNKERIKKGLETNRKPGQVDIRDPNLDVEKIAAQIQSLPAWDDCHSPLKPGDYIKARLLPMREFYALRQPVVYHRQSRVKWATLLMAAVCTVLAAYDYIAFVAAVSVLAAAAVSWAEFNQLQDKVSRYNHTIIVIHELVVWWSSLDEVNQSSSTNLDRLIVEGERAINAELTTWRAAVSATVTSSEEPENTNAQAAGNKEADGLRKKNA